MIYFFIDSIDELKHLCYNNKKLQKEFYIMSAVMTFSYDSRPIQTIVNQIKNINKRDGIDLQPSYQRGYIWGNEFKDKLWYSIIKGYPIGNISLRVRTDKNNHGAMIEVVDGQQRLTSIYKFIIGEYIIQGEIARNIIKYVIEYMASEKDTKLERLKRKLQNKGKISITFIQLPEVIQENINSFNISITNIANSSDEEISEYFRYLQNQERLRAGEIINSIPESPLESYIKRIENKDHFFNIMGFSNSRKQFDRVFYSILGLLDGAIGFGVLDKEVLKYASDCDELSDSAKKKCEQLLSQINCITSTEGLPFNLIKSNMRCMKFFLLTASLGLVDYTNKPEEKLLALGAINEKLSAFSSAKAGEVEKIFNSYSKEVIEEHRLLALISKGGHSFKRVENRMKILSYYINSFDNRMTPSGIIPI